MTMASVGVITMIPAIILMLLLPLALAVFLQIWLCKKGAKLGLILPGLSFLLTLFLTLTLVLNMSYVSAGSTLVSYVDENGQTVVVDEEKHDTYQQEIPVRAVGAIGVFFVIGNIPTLIFLGIWLHARNRRVKTDDLKRMNIEDLE